jgi:hypothetical protein
VPLLLTILKMPHKFVAVNAEPRLTHTSEDRLAPSATLVSRAESMFSEPLSCVGAMVSDDITGKGL